MLGITGSGRVEGDSVAHVGGRTALPYVAAFDGLRALAVIAVVAYHASLPEAPGGFFGVDVFFVISGYLVTALFLARARSTGSGTPSPDRADLLDFWRRRLTRLVPAALPVVALSGVVFVLLGVRSPLTLIAEAIAALGYAANWFFLFSDQSYFETIAMPSPFLHFWSLAVEAQFYLLWPVLLIGALRFGGRLTAFALAVSLAAISTLVAAGLYSPTTDPSRAYYGTDARVAGLLLGAALAIVITPARAGRVSRIPVEVAGWSALAVLLWLTTTVSEFDPFIYHGGFFVASSAALVVLFAALHGTNSLAWMLSRAPLRWLGERAYSIYLWHWPVFVLSQPTTAVDLHSFSLLLARLGVTLILADLSFRLVESRFRSGYRGGRFPRFELGVGPLRQRPWARPAGVFAVGLVAVVAAGGLPMRIGLAEQTAALAASYTGEPAPPPAPTGIHITPLAVPSLFTVAEGVARLAFADVQAPARDSLAAALRSFGAPDRLSQDAVVHVSAPEVNADAPSVPASSVDPDRALAAAVGTPPGSDLRAGGSPANAPSIGDGSTGQDGDEVSSSVASSGSVLPEPGPPTEVTPTGTPDPTVIGASVTIIGDSVALGAANALLSAMPGAVVDAEVGRQFWTTPQVIERLGASGALGDVVVLHLGANGAFTTAQFEAITSLLEGRTVIFVNITVPRRWEADVNRGLAERTGGLDDVLVADWNSASREQAAYFVADGVHLTAQGQAAFAAFIADAVAAAIAARG